jgi:hypothetical protein
LAAKVKFDESLWRHHLDGRGLDWVKQSLRAGRRFASGVQTTLDLGRGSAVSLAPPEFGSDGLYGFDRSIGIRASDGDNALDRVLSTVECNGGTLVIEDELARVGDPFLSRVPDRFSIYGEDILWRLAWPLSQPSAVIRKHSSGYPTNAFLLTSNIDEDKLDEPTAVQLTRSVRLIICAAYDAESFVLWSTDRS